MSAWLLMLCLPCLGVVVVLDRRLRPDRLEPLSLWDHACNLVVWLFIPVVGLVLTTLPALDAHTRLLFGKYLHYQVTEKLPAERRLRGAKLDGRGLLGGSRLERR